MTACCDVVIPYEFDSDLVEESVRSIERQVDVRCRIHLVQDGGEFLGQRQWAKGTVSSGIRESWNAEPKGPYCSVHRVFSQMTSPYFAIQDADDIAGCHFTPLTLV